MAMPQDLLIPRPRKIELTGGAMPLTLLHAEAPDLLATEARAADTLFQQMQLWGEALPCRLLLNTELPAEGYELVVAAEGVRIGGGDRAGVFYGIQTLRQLLEGARKMRRNELAALRIVDAPEFHWRSCMLDSARHFQSAAQVREVIDALARYKFNRFHWHLVDHFSWRIGFRRHAEMLESFPGHARSSGYYTPEEIREILAYAAERHIEVIPELEMPGHSSGVFAIHPELACPDGLPIDLTRGEYCIGNPASRRFLGEIIDETMEIFSGIRYLHLGGDEASPRHWQQCPVCQNAIRNLGLSGERDLEHHFMTELARRVLDHGVRPILWSSLRAYDPRIIMQCWGGRPLDPELSRGSLAGNHSMVRCQTSWIGAVAAAQMELALMRGADLINSRHDYTYLDYPMRRSEPHSSWMPDLPLERVYQFDPLPEETPTGRRSQVLGAEACLWTELVTPDRVMGKLFPRLLAFCETVWTPGELRDWADFRRRVRHHQR